MELQPKNTLEEQFSSLLIFIDLTVSRHGLKYVTEEYIFIKGRSISNLPNLYGEHFSVNMRVNLLKKLTALHVCRVCGALGICVSPKESERNAVAC